ncbi:toxin glutamine deamidase domain-containing protein [Streptomyces sp. NPDC017673]|uniref:toxin glutamine deamidase domain-containing protein n=1 Tax=unclassified Streptomyces TaxID=2593676 RepID=UPI00378FB7BF
MVDHVRNAGHGARGIVAGESPIPGTPGHVFNVVNHQNRVLFIDVQTGFVDPTYFNAFKLMRTN